MLLSFKKQGAHLVEASFSDQQSLVDAVKQVDVVICTMSGVHFRSHNLLMQLKLVEAIKAAGNIKRFLPSELAWTQHLWDMHLNLEESHLMRKMTVRKAIEDANIPFTYISANCFAGYFAGNLSQMGTLFPPRDKVLLYGDGNVKGRQLEKSSISEQDFLSSIKGQVGVGHFYHIFYEGCLTNLKLEKVEKKRQSFIHR
ncbi:NmrA-like domain [Sesbania bispinosa]|nr:NmrA-like domain [Sesbania bispinosa]